MYSSIPPCELSIEWENLVHDNKEKKKVILVVPNQENENVQKFIREVAEILENSNTFTCIMLKKTDLIYKFIKKMHPEGCVFHYFSSDVSLAAFSAFASSGAVTFSAVSLSRMVARRIFPLIVLGSSVTKSMMRGLL